MPNVELLNVDCMTFMAELPDKAFELAICDPPYQFGGHAYKMNNKKIDFHNLSEWSMERDGQVIVCENDKSNWMPFIPLGNQNTHTGTQKEVFWTNEPTSYGIKQQSLFSNNGVKEK